MSNALSTSLNKFVSFACSLLECEVLFRFLKAGCKEANSAIEREKDVPQLCVFIYIYVVNLISFPFPLFDGSIHSYSN